MEIREEFREGEKVIRKGKERVGNYLKKASDTIRENCRELWRKICEDRAGEEHQKYEEGGKERKSPEGQQNMVFAPGLRFQNGRRAIQREKRGNFRKRQAKTREQDVEICFKKNWETRELVKESQEKRGQGGETKEKTEICQVDQTMVGAVERQRGKAQREKGGKVLEDTESGRRSAKQFIAC